MEPNKKYKRFEMGYGAHRTRAIHCIRQVDPLCTSAYNDLRYCVRDKDINILNHLEVRKECSSVPLWHQKCVPQLRRYHVEEMYVAQVNRRLYTRERLAEYNHSKRHYTDPAVLDARF